MRLEQLGPYRLGRKLGQGGMGAVYEGVDTTTGEAAAVKVLSPVLAIEEGFRARFGAEIDSLKKLRHGNIVRLFGYGEQDGVLFYAMELVPGISLEDELRAGRRFQWREVSQIAIKLCRALKHAHDHGIIHRDLKPANLLLTPDGDVKLSDFGIARLFGNTRMTSDGGVLGTAEYMAPEQADGRAVTERSDLYSLGGVLYTLLAGRPPFRAQTMVEMLQLQRYAEPEPVTHFAPQTPAELARIVHQLLEKDPSRRYPNALILARSLEAMERGLSISQTTGDDFVLASPDATIAGDLEGGPPGITAFADTLMAPSTEAPGVETPPPQVGATEATMAYTPSMQRKFGSAPPTPTPAPVEPPATRFTKVEERRPQEPSALGEFIARLVSPQTLALLVGLAVLAGVGWYLMRPPSADALYDQIAGAADEGSLESLKAAAPRIDKFLTRYPDDPRSERVQAWQDELKQTHPVQRAFTEAKRLALISPEVALPKFQAIIDVYGESEENSDASQHFVKLARVQVKRLQKHVDESVAAESALVESRLARAGDLEHDHPATARKIYLGIVELYDQKPWAAPLVARAKTALTAVPAPEAAAAQESK